MHVRTLVPSLAGLLVTAPLALAAGMERRASPPDPALAFQTPPTPASKPEKPATPDVVRGTALLELHLRGLDDENRKEVRESLGALTYTDYGCQPCQVHEARAGKCRKCGGQLKAEERPLFTKVTLPEDKSLVQLAITEDHATRLSQVEKVLRKHAVEVDPQKTPLPGRAELVVGGGTAEARERLEQALADAKLFESLKVAWDATTRELRVAVRAGAKPPVQAQVAAALEGVKLRLVDVVWGEPQAAPPMPG